MNEDAFLLALSALLAAFVGLQLRHGRAVLGWSAGEWLFVEKADNEGRFWLFIAGESLVVLLLIGQALSARG